MVKTRSLCCLAIKSPFYFFNFLYIGGISHARKTANPRIQLLDLQEGDDSPRMAVYALDRGQKILHVADVDETGYFQLPDKTLAAAIFVAIGPKVST